MNHKDEILAKIARAKAAHLRALQPYVDGAGFIHRPARRKLHDITRPTQPNPDTNITADKALTRFYKANSARSLTWPLAAKMTIARSLGDSTKLIVACYENCIIAIEKSYRNKHTARLYYNKQHIATTFLDTPTFRTDMLLALVRTRIILKRFSLTEQAQTKILNR